MAHRLIAPVAVALVVASCATELPRPVEVPASTPRHEAPAASPSDRDTPEQPVLVGTVVKVSDGDTIKVQLSSGPITVRFSSIDAPEKNQPWGAQAQAALTQRVDQRQVALDVTTQDRYDRLIATVYLDDENMNACEDHIAPFWSD